MRCAGVATALLLAACSDGREEAAPVPAPTPTVAAPRTLVAADFDPAILGAEVEGTRQENVALGTGLARMTSYVACPRAMTDCDPATAPEGTAYTYVMIVTPESGDAPQAALSPTPPAGTVAPVEGSAELVRMTRAAPSFTGAVGFSRGEAEAALGAANAMTVTLDQNRISWRVTGGSGWLAGKPITLWWQSTRAPGKPATAFRLEYAGQRADVRAPFPAADKPVER